MLVSMTGHHDTEIRDETLSSAAIDDNQNLRHLNVTLYESSVNVLRIELDCAQQSNNGLLDGSCSLNYYVNIWIDLNDDEKFDDSENRVLQRSLVSNLRQPGTYYLEVCIPSIDDINTKVGPHRLRLDIMPNEDYRKTCSHIDGSDTREYIVNIIPKVTCEGKISSLVLLSQAS